jgi:anti-anti-sigma factor
LFRDLKSEIENSQSKICNPQSKSSSLAFREKTMSAVEIRAKLKEGAACIYPGPYLNQLRGERIEKRCQELLESGVRQIVINFKETELINSIGISILLGVIEAVNDARGRLVLTDLSASNRELFEMLGLSSHIEIEETEEAALRKLREAAGLVAR